MNHNFKRSLDINNKNVDDNINKINSIINQMRLVDENLKSLFSFEETLNDHDALLLVIIFHDIIIYIYIYIFLLLIRFY
ncbi:hypothetical protein C923_04494 [Plasmodium falciparum UGT5.1]|uniref:Uncharacterized protein n=1 Tax=Plasmodium falciparum UGT5.1 TaxID=1237627 RepID=W7JJ80_PLAFA|nr:hypothetical protein C923_04494 [Plasmodium falciparum UGT5.1]